MDFLIELILMIQLSICWIVCLPFSGIKSIAHKVGKYYCTQYLNYLLFIIGILLLACLYMAQTAYSTSSTKSSSGQFSMFQFEHELQAVRARDQILFSLTMLLLLYRISRLLSESYKLELNATALKMQSKGQGAFVSSLLDDNKKLEAETKRLKSPETEKDDSSSNQDETEIKSQRKQTGTKKDEITGTDQPIEPAEINKQISDDNKSQTTKSKEDKTTDTNEKQTIENKPITKKDKDKDKEEGIAIVLEEMRRQIELAKRNAVEKEKLHQEEVKALKLQIEELELVFGGNKEKKD